MTPTLSLSNPPRGSARAREPQPHARPRPRRRPHPRPHPHPCPHPRPCAHPRPQARGHDWASPAALGRPSQAMPSELDERVGACPARLERRRRAGSALAPTARTCPTNALSPHPSPPLTRDTGLPLVPRPRVPQEQFAVRRSARRAVAAAGRARAGAHGRGVGDGPTDDTGAEVSKVLPAAATNRAGVAGGGGVGGRRGRRG
jgi:hypothetical protein